MPTTHCHALTIRNREASAGQLPTELLSDLFRIGSIYTRNPVGLLPYLSRSKSYSTLLYLKSVPAPQSSSHQEYRISAPCSVRLSLNFERNVKDFLPLLGDLCRLTELACALNTLNKGPTWLWVVAPAPDIRRT